MVFREWMQYRAIRESVQGLVSTIDKLYKAIASIICELLKTSTEIRVVPDVHETYVGTLSVSDYRIASLLLGALNIPM